MLKFAIIALSVIVFVAVFLIVWRGLELEAHTDPFDKDVG